jgi:hypothetical protein
MDFSYEECEKYIEENNYDELLNYVKFDLKDNNFFYKLLSSLSLLNNCKNEKILKHIIDNAIDLECETSDKWRPIHLICKYSTPEMIKYIIDKGVNLECETDLGYKPIYFICRYSTSEMIAYMVDKCNNLKCEEINKYMEKLNKKIDYINIDINIDKTTKYCNKCENYGLIFSFMDISETKIYEVENLNRNNNNNNTFLVSKGIFFYKKLYKYNYNNKIEFYKKWYYNIERKRIQYNYKIIYKKSDVDICLKCLYNEKNCVSKFNYLIKNIIKIQKWWRNILFDKNKYNYNVTPIICKCILECKCKNKCICKPNNNYYIRLNCYCYYKCKCPNTCPYNKCECNMKQKLLPLFNFKYTGIGYFLGYQEYLRCNNCLYHISKYNLELENFKIYEKLKNKHPYKEIDNSKPYDIINNNKNKNRREFLINNPDLKPSWLQTPPKEHNNYGYAYTKKDDKTTKTVIIFKEN